MYENMIAITNRHLCDEFSYFEQLQFIASLHPKAIVLREKDLSPEEYALSFMTSHNKNHKT